MVALPCDGSVVTPSAGIATAQPSAQPIDWPHGEAGPARRPVLRDDVGIARLVRRQPRRPPTSSGSATTRRARAAQRHLDRGGRRGTVRRLDRRRAASGSTTRATPSGSRRVARAATGARSTSPRSRRLTEEGRMRPAGVAAFEARTADRTGVYSYEREVERPDRRRARAVPRRTGRLGGLGSAPGVVPEGGAALGDEREAGRDARAAAGRADRGLAGRHVPIKPLTPPRTGT